ncbi:hypothetical protein KFF05_01225 [bacterium SCSIO 12827]|nr:hypothetical protein KFF05_01225 [bacterium SCSIO 12827]
MSKGLIKTGELHDKLRNGTLAMLVGYGAGWFKSWDYLSQHLVTDAGSNPDAMARILTLTDLAQLVATISGTGIIALFLAISVSSAVDWLKPESVIARRWANTFTAAVLAGCLLAYAIGIAYSILITSRLGH